MQESFNAFCPVSSDVQYEVKVSLLRLGLIGSDRLGSPPKITSLRTDVAYVLKVKRSCLVWISGSQPRSVITRAFSM